MRLRETPETDAHSPKCYSITTPDGTTTRYVPADFARRLERERDEAREGQMEALCDFQRLARKIDDIRDVFDHQDEDWTGSTPLADAVSKVIRERDEAREDTPWHANGETKDEWFASQREKYAVIERERDEAREAIRELLGMVPRPSCDMFHHSKKDRHGYDEPCPLVDRYNAKIKKAEEAAK